MVQIRQSFAKSWEKTTQKALLESKFWINSKTFSKFLICLFFMEVMLFQKKKSSHVKSILKRTHTHTHTISRLRNADRPPLDLTQSKTQAIFWQVLCAFQYPTLINFFHLWFQEKYYKVIAPKGIQVRKGKKKDDEVTGMVPVHMYITATKSHKNYLYIIEPVKGFVRRRNLKGYPMVERVETKVKKNVFFCTIMRALRRMERNRD
jgi:hypothetical protein